VRDCGTNVPLAPSGFCGQKNQLNSACLSSYSFENCITVYLYYKITRIIITLSKQNWSLLLIASWQWSPCCQETLTRNCWSCVQSRITHDDQPRSHIASFCAREMSLPVSRFQDLILKFWRKKTARKKTQRVKRIMASSCNSCWQRCSVCVRNVYRAIELKLY